MKKEPWYTRFYEAYRIMFMVFGFGILFSWGLIAGTHLYDRHFPRTEIKSELSPGELVDLAMQIPGSIVISPHRDLVEMGLISYESGNPNVKAYFCSPAIAVHTKSKWCAWELGGMGCTYRYDTAGHTDHTTLEAHNIGGATSWQGYQAAYDSFTKCVSDGNAIKVQSQEIPQIPHCGANPCPDDTATMKKAVRANYQKCYDDAVKSGGYCKIADHKIECIGCDAPRFLYNPTARFLYNPTAR